MAATTIPNITSPQNSPKKIELNNNNGDTKSILSPHHLPESDSTETSDLNRNRRLCEKCKKTYHRNSLKRHQIICYKTSPTTDTNAFKLNNNDTNNNNNNDKNVRKNDDEASKLEDSPNKRLCLRSAVEASKVVVELTKTAVKSIMFEKSPSKSKSATTTNGEKINCKNNNKGGTSGKPFIAAKSSKTATENEISNGTSTTTAATSQSSRNVNSLVCLLCNTKISDSLEAHYKANHKLEVNSKRYYCTICSKNFNFDNFMHWYHYKEHHTVDKNYKCNECNLVFSFLQSLLFHKSTEHLKEMCKSKYCERKKKDGTIRRDPDKDSTGQANSDMSGTSSTTSSSPRSSIDSPPSNLSYYDSDTKSPKSDIDQNSCMFKIKTKCPKCNLKKNEMLFDNPHELLEHCRECHIWTKEHQVDPVYEPEFFCPLCGLIFVTTNTLIKHLKTSHEDIIFNVNFYMEKLGYLERPLLEYQCSVCYEVLESPEEYNFHRRVHGLSYLSFLKSTSMS